MFSYPFSYGYSCVGRVERASAGTEEGALVFAFHPHQDVFVVGAEDAISVEGIEPRAATLLPLVETALQASVDAGAGAGDVVVVQGLGVVGILTAALLTRAGATVIGSDPLEWRRKTGADLGVQAVSPEEVRSAAFEAGDGLGAALVVEATGNPEALVEALMLLRHEGTALVASWYGTKTATLPLGEEFHRKRLVIKSTQVSSIPSTQRARWDRRTRLESARRVFAELPVHLLATYEFPFDRAAEAYSAIDRAEEGLVHAALSYA
jgi:threonine dehydrogenase-like Zn-dependent dehydrogenase